MNHILGIDIGGSHMASGLVDADTGELDKRSLIRVKTDPGITAGNFLGRMIEQISAQQDKSLNRIVGVGVSVPGPFDYSSGICRISGVNKLESLFGIDFRQSVSSCLENINLSDIRFLNDAEAMLSGEIHRSKLLGRVLGITLGTGFGSSFFDGGKVMKSGLGIPPGSMLFDQPLKSGIADDYFSSRWFISEYFKLTGKSVTGVKELAVLAAYDEEVKKIFRQFGQQLSSFLLPYLADFEADTLLMGGNLAKANQLFIRELEQGLLLQDKNIRIEIIDNGESAAILGAAHALLNSGFKRPGPPVFNRKTTQHLIPLNKPETLPGKYDIYPAFSMGPGKILEGFDQLAEVLTGHKSIVVDGYIGVDWPEFTEKLGKALNRRGMAVSFSCIDAALKPLPEIMEMTGPFMGDDGSIFGKKYSGKLDDFFEQDKLSRIKPADNGGMNILYGSGAALADWEGPLLYIDLPKNELQFRSRAGGVQNLGNVNPGDAKAMYKRFYFVDWIALNKHKEQLLPRIDWLVDEQRINEISFVSANELRNALDRMAQSYFRVRPWFEPGPWGGQWIREHIQGLSEEVPNYAWSFELIVPENGLLFESDGLLLECSFDFLMYAHAREVLGRAHEVFGTEFPIRFDFLDTFEGGNLSVQCHPRPEYIKEHFGETFTQDETYYILDAGDNAEVYLGFREDIDQQKFRAVLEESHLRKEAINIPDFVQVHPSKKHDLFLIPGGTIHASGQDNLVLEISSTPYIFTFKMYDWLRLDLEGNPRPLNIEHAFKNLYFDRKGERIKKEFISQAVLLESGDNYKIVHLPTHNDHFYDARRVEFEKLVALKTGNKFFVCMLVEGDQVRLQTQHGPEVRFNYAETFVIPASAGNYKFIYGGTGTAKVVQAYVKDTFKI